MLQIKQSNKVRYIRKRHTILFVIGLINFFLMISLSSCKSSRSNYDVGYDLSIPSESIQLPGSLREVSGITLLDSTTVACIQDENGVVFIYDLVSHEIKTTLNFYDDGDYEGVCSVDTSIFILRSDGTLFEISNYKSTSLNVVSYPTEMTHANNEGLCYDKISNRLLIARKNKLGKGKGYKNKRAIYSFDLKTRKWKEDPVIEFDVDTVKKIALEEKIKLPLRNKKKKRDNEQIPVLRFASSEIAIHPITGKIFLLSSQDHLLFVVDIKGNVELVEPLNPLVFKQPEGIAFFKSGDILIANEGQRGSSTLLRFNYKPLIRN